MLFALCLLGCGGGTDESGPQILELGAYSYTFGEGEGKLEGSLIVTYADADSLETYLDVPGMDSATTLNFWNVDAYVIYGYPDDGGIAATRIWRAGGGTKCTGKYITFFGGSPVSVDMDCKVSFEGD